jgi:hypothetical protein
LSFTDADAQTDTRTDTHTVADSGPLSLWERVRVRAVVGRV